MFLLNWCQFHLNNLNYFSHRVNNVATRKNQWYSSLIILTFPSAPFSVQSISNIPLLRLFLWPRCAFTIQTNYFCSREDSWEPEHPRPQGRHTPDCFWNVTSCCVPLIEMSIEVETFVLHVAYFTFSSLLSPSKRLRSVGFPLSHSFPHLSVMSHECVAFVYFIWCIFLSQTNHSPALVLY